ncbi:MAG: hypothetical protein Q6K80_06560 [Thermostichus sp. DG_1_6_bins_120]
MRFLPASWDPGHAVLWGRRLAAGNSCCQVRSRFGSGLLGYQTGQTRGQVEGRFSRAPADLQTVLLLGS